MAADRVRATRGPAFEARCAAIPSTTANSPVTHYMRTLSRELSWIEGFLQFVAHTLHTMSIFLREVQRIERNQKYAQYRDQRRIALVLLDLHWIWTAPLSESDTRCRQDFAGLETYSYR